MCIGLFFDEEYNHLYCTPAQGNWELKEGYRVPVLMYHAVCDELFSYGLWDMCVRPVDMEDQLRYLSENGCDTVFYDDLEHVDEYDKPIILTYDDGYNNLYDYLFPLLKKYNCKVVIYLVTDNIDEGLYNSLSREQILEMNESDLVSFQSHTEQHYYLTHLYGADEALREEFRNTILYIVRLIGKYPIAVAYPYGDAYNPETTSIAGDFHRFAVRMGLFPYYTGDDPLYMHRIMIERGLALDKYIERI